MRAVRRVRPGRIARNHGQSVAVGGHLRLHATGDVRAGRRRDGGDQCRVDIDDRRDADVSVDAAVHRRWFGPEYRRRTRGWRPLWNRRRPRDLRGPRWWSRTNDVWRRGRGHDRAAIATVDLGWNDRTDRADRTDWSCRSYRHGLGKPRSDRSPRTDGSRRSDWGRHARGDRPPRADRDARIDRTTRTDWSWHSGGDWRSRTDWDTGGDWASGSDRRRHTRSDRRPRTDRCAWGDGASRPHWTRVNWDDLLGAQRSGRRDAAEELGDFWIAWADRWLGRGGDAGGLHVQRASGASVRSTVRHVNSDLEQERHRPGTHVHRCLGIHRRLHKLRCSCCRGGRPRDACRRGHGRHRADVQRHAKVSIARAHLERDSARMRCPASCTVRKSTLPFVNTAADRTATRSTSPRPTRTRLC